MDRCESKSDTRAKWVSLTLKGKKLIQKLVPIVEKIDEEFFGGLSQKDQSILIQTLNRLAK
jgi:DNA-binding MarR family transcriptional regulator